MYLRAFFNIEFAVDKHQGQNQGFMQQINTDQEEMEKKVNSSDG